MNPSYQSYLSKVVSQDDIYKMAYQATITSTVNRFYADNAPLIMTTVFAFVAICNAVYEYIQFNSINIYAIGFLPSIIYFVALDIAKSVFSYRKRMILMIIGILPTSVITIYLFSQIDGEVMVPHLYLVPVLHVGAAGYLTWCCWNFDLAPLRKHLLADRGLAELIWNKAEFTHACYLFLFFGHCAVYAGWACYYGFNNVSPNDKLDASATYQQLQFQYAIANLYALVINSSLMFFFLSALGTLAALMGISYHFSEIRLLKPKKDSIV